MKQYKLEVANLTRIENEAKWVEKKYIALAKMNNIDYSTKRALLMENLLNELYDLEQEEIEAKDILEDILFEGELF